MAFQFYDEVLKSARHFLAPMVDQSELAWRLLGRKYGVEVTFTPMIHAKLFVENPHYRAENMQFDPSDRPLIAQFCANDPEIFAQAVQLIQDQCDAVDLNLGCPQGIAKKGHYGAFLQEDWSLIEQLLTRAISVSKVPITAKCRVFDDAEKTIRYAKMLESTGIQLLTVHGRTREQKAQLTGLADWEQIKAVKQALRIPVIANGNIQYFEDIQRCIDETRVDGVMSAEGHLHNPAIFTPFKLSVFEASNEYLAICREHLPDMSAIRAHIFKLLQFTLSKHPTFRSQFAAALNVDEFSRLVGELGKVCRAGCQSIDWSADQEPTSIKEPHWMCQPYERKSTEAVQESKQADDLRLDVLALRLERKSRKRAAQEARLKAAKLGKLDLSKGRLSKLCTACVCNNRGGQCDKQMCKACCRATPEVKCLFHNVS